jgi:hypothetical protein
MRSRLPTRLLATAGLTLLLAGPAVAQGHHDGGRGGFPAHGFTRHDEAHWRGGGWHHEVHGGRLGWWWVVGPEWYFYPAPIYPYPSPYIPPVIAAPQPNMWYWCAAPAGYYPFAAQCSVQWQAVPARPPG